jgi:hypothetical protein
VRLILVEAATEGVGSIEESSECCAGTGSDGTPVGSRLWPICLSQHREGSTGCAEAVPSG